MEIRELILESAKFYDCCFDDHVRQFLTRFQLLRVEKGIEMTQNDQTSTFQIGLKGNVNSIGKLDVDYSCHRNRVSVAIQYDAQHGGYDILNLTPEDALQLSADLLNCLAGNLQGGRLTSIE